MKTIFFIILSQVLTYNSCKVEQIQADRKIEINKIIDRWHLAASQANSNVYFACLDEDAMYLGKNSKQICTKKDLEQISKPLFEKGKAWNFKPIKRVVYFTDDYRFAWFNETLETADGLCKSTGVLCFNNNTWKIKYYQLAVCKEDKNIDFVALVKKQMN